MWDMEIDCCFYNFFKKRKPRKKERKQASITAYDRELKKKFKFLFIKVQGSYAFNNRFLVCRSFFFFCFVL